VSFLIVEDGGNLYGVYVDDGKGNVTLVTRKASVLTRKMGKVKTYLRALDVLERW